MISSLSVHHVYTHAQQLAGQSICVSGWVRTIRGAGGGRLAFMSLHDGTCFNPLQVVLAQDTTRDFERMAALGAGSAVLVSGKLALTPGAQQSCEVQATHIQIEGDCPDTYPLQKKRHSFEFLRTIAHLRPRTNTFGAVMRVRSIAAQALHAFFAERGFIYVHTPIITTSDCEGAGEMFQVTTLDLADPPRDAQGAPDYAQDFFGRRASLTVSGQLNGETHALALRNIYTFGPTFRSERSHTPRHAAEFWMLEPEVAFADLQDIMNLAEDMMRCVIQHLLRHAVQELEFFNSFVDKGLLARLRQVARSDFARVSYTEAIRILQGSGRAFEYPIFWGADLQTEHERYLAEDHFGKPVFVHDYPEQIKAFYMRLNDDGKTVAATDLLVPGVGEIIGGSQREERLDMLLARMQQFGLDPQDYWWYTDLRKYGTARHAGFGLGFERLIMYVTGMKNIRDVQSFPRTTGQADF